MKLKSKIEKKEKESDLYDIDLRPYNY